MRNGFSITFVMPETQVSLAVKSLQAIIGCYPYETVLVLQTGRGFIRGKAGRYTVMGKGVLTGALAGSNKCQQLEAKNIQPKFFQDGSITCSQI